MHPNARPTYDTDTLDLGDRDRVIRSELERLIRQGILIPISLAQYDARVPTIRFEPGYDMENDSSLANRQLQRGILQREDSDEVQSTDFN